MVNTNRKQILYLDCTSGISGDMFAAAMLDLGADRNVLQRALDSIPVRGFRTEISRVKKQAIDCCDFKVVLDAELDNHDDDMEYLFGTHEHHHGQANDDHGHEHHHDHGQDGNAYHHDHSHSQDGNAYHHDHSHSQDGNAYHHDHGHSHDGNAYHHDHGHSHDGNEQHHDHDHGYAEHGSYHGNGHDGSGHTHAAHSLQHEHSHHDSSAHVHRNLQDVREILAAVDMTETARELADRIFVILARAEAKAHGATVDTVHFHEVGAVDSIVDIVTAAVCFDNLHVDGVYVSPLFEGSGTIRCAHGLLPIPVPAVANIIADSSLQMAIHPEFYGEYITPTGAAIAAAIATEESLPHQFGVKDVGLGAGKRNYERANYLRAMLLEADESQAKHSAEAAEAIYKLETDIDDCSGEVLGYLLERLMDAGARDAHYLPVYMKKNRPAWQLQVICTEDKIEDMEELIFTESTSIGIRRIRMDRTVLAREIREVDTPYGIARVKVCSYHGNEKYYPEYESAAALAQKSGLTLAEIYDGIREMAYRQGK